MLHAQRPTNVDPLKMQDPTGNRAVKLHARRLTNVDPPNSAESTGNWTAMLHARQSGHFLKQKYNCT
jgi:hypothetical protein